MTSKHYRWQTRWAIDRGAQRATHDSGIIVAFDGAPGGRLTDCADAQAALAAKNGPHNTPIMLARLLREAAELYNLPGADHGPR